MLSWYFGNEKLHDPLTALSICKDLKIPAAAALWQLIKRVI
jgi:hypothetical protein